MAQLNMGDPNILIPEEDDNELEVLCPICKINVISPDEDMCAACAHEHAVIPDPEETAAEDWTVFADDDTPPDEPPPEISLSELAEEEEALEEEEEEVEEVDDGDDYVIPDDDDEEDLDDDDDEE
jgi:hypothetical protein